MTATALQCHLTGSVGTGVPRARQTEPDGRAGNDAEDELRGQDSRPLPRNNNVA